LQKISQSINKIIHLILRHSRDINHRKPFVMLIYVSVQQRQST